MGACTSSSSETFPLSSMLLLNWGVTTRCWWIVLIGAKWCAEDGFQNKTGEVWPAAEELSHIFRRGFVPLSGLQGGGGGWGGAGIGHVDLTPRWQKGHVCELTTPEVSPLTAPLSPPSASPSHSAKRHVPPPPLPLLSDSTLAHATSSFIPHPYLDAHGANGGQT